MSLARGRDMYVSVQISEIKLPGGGASTNHPEWQTDSDVSITFLNQLNRFSLPIQC